MSNLSTLVSEYTKNISYLDYMYGKTGDREWVWKAVECRSMRDLIIKARRIYPEENYPYTRFSLRYGLKQFDVSTGQWVMLASLEELRNHA